MARSLGAAGTSSQIIQAQLRKNYDLTDGALVLRGAAALAVSGVLSPRFGQMFAGERDRHVLDAGSDGGEVAA